MSTIILTGGGTAGHCTPNIALLPYLKENFENIYYIGSENGIEKEIATKNGISYYEISTAKLKRKITLTNFKIPFKVIKGINQAKKIIKETKPDIIFSKGGFVSIPVVIAGYLSKIPVISHESDLTVGLANKIAGKFSKKVLTSFPETAKGIKNGQFVGPPIRRELFSVNKNTAYEKFGFKNKKPVLTVTGGSQGAKAINDAIREILPSLLEKFNVIHLCGKGNLANLKLEGYYQTEFLNNIENAFAISSLCVTRAGSNTLFELLALKIPCLVIPLPKDESRGDQLVNARYFQGKKAVNVLYQEKITSNSLLQYVYKTYNERNTLIQNITDLSIDNSNEKIYKIILDNVKR